MWERARVCVFESGSGPASYYTGGRLTGSSGLLVDPREERARELARGRETVIVLFPSLVNHSRFTYLS